jgi:hypothetical protein
MNEWNTKSLTTLENWSEIFEFVRSGCTFVKKTGNSFWNSLLPFLVLQEIRSSTKYKTSAQEERTTAPTLTGN